MNKTTALLMSLTALAVLVVAGFFISDRIAQRIDAEAEAETAKVAAEAAAVNPFGAAGRASQRRAEEIRYMLSR